MSAYVVNTKADETCYLRKETFRIGYTWLTDNRSGPLLIRKIYLDETGKKHFQATYVDPDRNIEFIAERDTLHDAVEEVLDMANLPLAPNKYYMVI